MEAEAGRDGRSGGSGSKALWDKWLRTQGIRVFLRHSTSRLKVGVDLLYAPKKQAVTSAGNSGPRKVAGCLEGWHRERTRESHRPGFQSQMCTSLALAPPFSTGRTKLTSTAGETKRNDVYSRQGPDTPNGARDTGRRPARHRPRGHACRPRASRPGHARKRPGGCSVHRRRRP